ncbi:MAG: hypothetical protein GF320_19785 [Armatimonadia bacterium]|nr:hypothetical protein [Armatimonadia bacterium]
MSPVWHVLIVLVSWVVSIVLTSTPFFGAAASVLYAPAIPVSIGARRGTTAGWAGHAAVVGGLFLIYVAATWLSLWMGSDWRPTWWLELGMLVVAYAIGLPFYRSLLAMIERRLRRG